MVVLSDKEHELLTLVRSQMDGFDEHVKEAGRMLAEHLLEVEPTIDRQELGRSLMLIAQHWHLPFAVAGEEGATDLPPEEYRFHGIESDLYFAAAYYLMGE